MAADLQARYEALHREMVEEFERALVRENQGLLYTLLGWQHLVTCVVSYYLLEVREIDASHQWVYAALWIAQALVAVGLYKSFSRRPQPGDSPLKGLNRRVWTAFLLLAFNVAGLNAVAGLPVFVYMPVLATLSSFAFAAASVLIARRLLLAAGLMFITGILMARFPDYAFLLSGGSWLVILQTLGVIFLRKRRRWRADHPPQPDNCADALPQVVTAPEHA